MNGQGPRRRFTGLRGRITATVVLCVLTATVIVSTATYLLQDRHSRERFGNAALLATRSDGAQAAALAGGTVNPVKEVIAYLAGRQGVEWMVVDLSGPEPVRWYSDRIPAELVDPRRTDVLRTRGDPVRVQAGERTFLAVLSDAGPGIEIVEFYDLRPLEVELTQLRRNTVLVGLPVLLCTAVLGAVIAGRIARPIERASAAARRMGAGDLSPRLPDAGRDELAELGSAMNEMAGELDRTLTELRRMDTQHRRFTADVAHELRTPLASLVAAADSLDVEDPTVRHRAAVLLRQQTRRLATLVEDLLEVSRFDAGAAVADRCAVDLGALAAEVAATCERPADVRVTVVGDPVLQADPRRLHAVLRNLVANGLAHGAPPVLVEVRGRADTVEVVVSDHGDGVPAGLEALLFDRFVRGDPARGSGGSGGSGLGLAIARSNAELHGGSLRLRPGAGRGASFELALPRG
ncbi:sensor histidine kinase [Geodermatophilus ruber]|uniref:histidine kinase n=1 Tax=Geodermatophilus ruber TaxID=504800 RepID=A0A1I4EZL3_9ACTN|nr:HAMP domain-containing sensor histidine kinase [Geodermatophilus ruber]SFL09571.1 two-component system, OmpR family, sensor histidine kinase MtrB [Geodermatophilus ruber]